MKQIFLLLMVLAAGAFNAQTSCQNAQPFCAGGVSGVNFPATVNGPPAQTGPNYGCLGTQPNPAWYYLQIGASGSLDILIQGQITSPPGPGQDVDFICWGPFSSLAGICNSLTATNIVDCSYSASYTETLNITSGITGEYYLVLITNFANVTQDIVFTQFGGTGNTNCALVSSNHTICAGSSVSIVTSPPSGLTNISYSLNPGNLTSTTPTFVVTPSVNVTYSIYASGTSSANVVLTQSATSNVTVNPMPLVAPTVTNPTCTSNISAFNLALTFTPANPPPAYNITWSSIPNGVASFTQTSVSGFINPGPYSATVTAAGGCSVVANFTLLPQPAPATFTLTPPASVYSITCYQPTVTLSAGNAANNYTWSAIGPPDKSGDVADFTINDALPASGRTWTLNVLNPNSGCTATRTFVIAQNTTQPTGAVTPSYQVINCTFSSVTNVTISATPTINVLQNIYTSSNANFSTNAGTAVYSPGAPDTYTYCVTDAINGCTVCKQFTVTSSQGFPVFNVVSPQHFTLGCSSTSLAVVSIINANTTPPGFGVTYGIINPGTGTAVATGTNPNFSITLPGTYTLVTKDAVSLCETRIPVSVITNTFGPALDSVSVPRQTLNCNFPSVTLQAFCQTPNTSYLWSYGGVTGNLPGSTITINANTVAPTNTVVGNYTLTLTDNNNLCLTTSVVPVVQNLYAPIAKVSLGEPAITCKTSTILLTNNSSSGVPDNSGFQKGVVVGYVWDGPSPQRRMQISTTYVAATVGDYTMVARDIDNGCVTRTVVNIADGRIYPSLATPSTFPLDCGSSSAKISVAVLNSNSNLSYYWQLPLAAPSGSLTSKILDATTLGEYRVLITNTLNGCASIGSASVIPGKLNAGFEADVESGYAPLQVNFTNLSASTTGSNNINTAWDFGNGTHSITTSAGISPATLYNQPGTFFVKAIVNKGNCQAVVTKTISVELPSALLVPNVFTPNGDKVNDEFFLRTSNLSRISMLVYDRWGHKVFDEVSYNGNIVWDGKNLLGVDVDEGVYLYVLKAEGKDGKTFEQKGNISLFR